MSTDDHNCGEVVYEDYTLFTCRPILRDVVCGTIVDPEKAGIKIDPGTHSIAWYFGLSKE